MQRTYTIDDIIQLYRDYPGYFSPARKYDKLNEKESNFQKEFFLAIELICIDELIGEDTDRPAFIYRYTDEAIRAAYRDKVEEYQMAVQASDSNNHFLPLYDFFARHPTLRKIIFKYMDVLEQLALAYEGTLETNKILMTTFYQMKEPEFKATLLKFGFESSRLDLALDQIKHLLQKVDIKVPARVYTVNLDLVAQNWLFKVNVANKIKQAAEAYLKKFGIKSSGLEEAVKLMNCEEIIKQIETQDVFSLYYQAQIEAFIKEQIKMRMVENILKLNLLKDSIFATTGTQFRPSTNPLDKLIGKYLKQPTKQEAVKQFVHEHPSLSNVLIYFAQWNAGDFRQEFDKCIKQIFDACIQDDVPKLKDAIKIYIKSTEAREFFYDATTREMIIDIVALLDTTAKVQDEPTKSCNP